MTEQVFVLPFEQSLPLHRDPLASCFKAWAAIPAVSSWVLNKIQQGYSLQFSRRLQRCYSNFCSRQRNSRSPTRSTDIACKRCRGNHAPREQQLRLFQLLLTHLSVEDIEDIYLFGTMITGLLLIGLGFALGYRRIKETGTAVQSLTRLPVMIEAVGRAVSIETETINRNMVSITEKLTALQRKIDGDQNGQ